MAFERAWTNAFEAAPDDDDLAAQGALHIRQLKVDVRERLDRDHEIGDALDGTQGHKIISFTKDYDDDDIDLPTERGTDTGYLFPRGKGLMYKPRDGDEQGLGVQIISGSITAAIGAGSSKATGITIPETIASSKIVLLCIEDASDIWARALFLTPEKLNDLTEATAGNSLAVAANRLAVINTGVYRRVEPDRTDFIGIHEFVYAAKTTDNELLLHFVNDELPASIGTAAPVQIRLVILG